MAKVKIGIVDYGLGNLYNVQRALHYLGGASIISSSPEELSKTDKIVLPGVGAFGEGMRNLSKNGLKEGLIEAENSGKTHLRYLPWDATSIERI